MNDCKISDMGVINFLLDRLGEEHEGLREETIKTLKDEYGFDYLARIIEEYMF